MKISLSNIFLLLVIAGLIAGWWYDHRRLRGERQEMMRTLSLVKETLERVEESQIVVDQWRVEQPASWEHVDLVGELPEVQE